MKLITRIVSIVALVTCNSSALVTGALAPVQVATQAAMRRDMIAGATIFAVGDVAAQFLTRKRDAVPATSATSSAAIAAVVPTGGGAISFDKHRLSSAALLGCVWSGICVPAVYSFVESLFPGRSAKKIFLKMLVTCSILSTVGNYVTMLARRLMMLFAPGGISDLGKRASIIACVQNCNEDIPEVIADDLKIWPLYDIACYSIVPPSLRPITTALMSSVWATYMSVVSAKSHN